MQYLSELEMSMEDFLTEALQVTIMDKWLTLIATLKSKATVTRKTFIVHKVFSFINLD